MFEDFRKSIKDFLWPPQKKNPEAYGFGPGKTTDDVRQELKNRGEKISTRTDRRMKIADEINNKNK